MKRFKRAALYLAASILTLGRYSDRRSRWLDWLQVVTGGSEAPNIKELENVESKL